MSRSATYREVFDFFKSSDLEEQNLLDFVAAYKDDSEAYRASFEKTKSEQWMSAFFQAESLPSSLLDPKEPNQKWHLLVSYFGVKLYDKKYVGFDWNDDFAPYWQQHAKCPELMLWMAQAAGIEHGKQEEALKAATICCEAGKKLSATLDPATASYAEKECRKLAARMIRRIIPWQDVSDAILQKD